MSLITPSLYLGDANHAQDINFLKRKRISLIVNCAQEIPNYHEGKFSYWRLNLSDIPTQSLLHVLDKVADKIIEVMQNGKNVFVHCAAGISRSTSIIIYTLMKSHKWDFETAFTYVRSMHPSTNPNPGFIQQLVKSQSNLNIQPPIQFPHTNNPSRRDYDEYGEPIARSPQRENPNSQPPLYQQPPPLQHPRQIEENRQLRSQPAKSARFPEQNGNVNEISSSYENRIRQQQMQQINQQQINQQLDEGLEMINPSQEQQNNVQRGNPKSWQPTFESAGGGNVPIKLLPHEQIEGKQWSSLTFDSSNDEKPQFISTGKGRYAQIFS
jgi:predicted protein tyrosine phosphatase